MSIVRKDLGFYSIYVAIRANPSKAIFPATYDTKLFFLLSFSTRIVPQPYIRTLLYNGPSFSFLDLGFSSKCTYSFVRSNAV